MREYEFPQQSSERRPGIIVGPSGCLQLQNMAPCASGDSADVWTSQSAPCASLCANLLSLSFGSLRGLDILCQCAYSGVVHAHDERLRVCCMCAYIKQPLTAIGHGSSAAGVFALAASQHSTFLCDIQRRDLKKPAQRRSSLSFPSSLLIFASSASPFLHFTLRTCTICLTSLPRVLKKRNNPP